MVIKNSSPLPTIGLLIISNQRFIMFRPRLTLPSPQLLEASRRRLEQNADGDREVRSDDPTHLERVCVSYAQRWLDRVREKEGKVVWGGGHFKEDRSMRRIRIRFEDAVHEEVAAGRGDRD